MNKQKENIPLPINLGHNPKKILVFKLRKLGDVLLTTPAIRQLKELYPEAEITVISEPLGVQVFQFSSFVDRVWVLHRHPTYVDYIKLGYKVYKEQFDIVIDFYHHNKTALITILSRAPYRLGFSYEKKKAFSYNYTVALTEDNRTLDYSAHHNLKLTEILGTNYDDFKLVFEIDQEVKDYGALFAREHNFSDKVIAFCAQSERSNAQVSPELLANIGNFLIRKGYKLYFVYGPKERDLAEPVYEKITKKNECIFDYEIPSIAQVRAIFEHCSMYIGNDGGNKHIAVTANIPTIGIFYGDNPKVWTPPKSSEHQYLQTKNNMDAFKNFKDIFEKWSEITGKFTSN